MATEERKAHGGSIMDDIARQNWQRELCETELPKHCTLMEKGTV